MARLFQEKASPETKLIIGNEGSSRSSKTWDIIHFIVAFCDENRSTPQDIYILRDTLVNCRDFTLKEFQDCLRVIGIYNPRYMVNSPKPVYRLFGHKIKFRGLDEEKASEGYPSDLLFFNEVLEQSKSVVDGLIMRCRKMVIMDWNPKYTAHWVFKMEKRSDTVFLHSTYKNNRHLQKSVIKEIESYNPAVPANVKEGTADKFKWEVYGLGIRSNKMGLVFQNVTYVNKFPEDIEQFSYGMDFGMTAQTAIVKCGIRIRKPKSDLFLEKLFYAPTESSDVINQILNGLNKKHPGIGTTTHIWADNNQPGWIADLRNSNKSIFPTRKFPGSREYWISSIKRFNIHILKDPDFQDEQQNFAYRVVDGKQLSETVKHHDHIWSGAGYSVVGDFRDLLEDAVEEKDK